MAFGTSFGIRVCGIYKIMNTVNGRFYVGSSVNVESRIFKHLSFLRGGRHPNAHLQAAFSMHGEDVFDFELLERCERGALIEREQFHMDVLRPAYNICAVAGNTLGFKHGPEAKARMTKANLGNKRMLGKHHTEATRRLLSEKASGRTLSEQHKTKLLASLKGNKHTAGRPLSAEHCEKVSAGLRRAWATASRSKEAAAERLRIRWADPAWKAQQAQKIKVGKAAKRCADGME